MKEDSKIFLKYLAYSLKPKIAVRNSTLWMWIAVIISIVIALPFIKFELTIKFLIIGLIMLSVAFLQIYLWYKSGEYKHWWRQQLKIPSKSEIRELKNNHSQEVNSKNVDKPLPHDERAMDNPLLPDINIDGTVKEEKT